MDGPWARTDGDGAPLPSPPPTPPLVVVKLGGAAITHKDRLETPNAAVLAAACAQVATAHRAGIPLIVVHGAGSFGHHHASAARLAAGGDPAAPPAAVALAFAATRASVARLTALVVAELVDKHSVPAVALPPFAGGWATAGGGAVLAADGAAAARAALGAGLVPVLHGDAVLDARQRFAICSGDTVVARLAQKLPGVARAVFMTNVDGVFDRGPADPAARLLSRVDVGPGGAPVAAWAGGARVAAEGIDAAAGDPARDVTGGMAAKLAEAGAAAAVGVPALVVRAATAHAAAALALGAGGGLPGAGWVGTAVVRVPPAEAEPP